MDNPVLVVVCILAVLAAALHVYIFVLESVLWTTPRARAVFGTSADEAQTTKALAFNQGFYNLFLAALLIVGVSAVGVDSTVGMTLIAAGAACMFAAALVLLVSDATKRKAALTQGALPVLTLLALIVTATS